MYPFKRFCIVSTSLLMLETGAAAQQRDRKSLEKLNKEIEVKRIESEKIQKESLKLSKDISDTQKKLVSIAANIKGHEGKIAGYDRRLSELQKKKRELSRTIEGNSLDLVKAIAVFENMSKVPRGYLIFSPSKIENIFKSSLLLRSVIAQLNASRAKFTRDLSDMIILEGEITRAKLDIYSLSLKVKDEKEKVSKLIKSKQASYKRLSAKSEQTQREIKKMVSESKTIEEFLKKAENLRRSRGAKKGPARKLSGRVQLPVAGRITTYFGEKRMEGVRSKGIYIKPVSGAQAVSPAEADVVFSGSFYGYKNLLILRTHDGYYMIVGGMGSVVAGEGQSLLPGEPIGEAGGGELYIEIREDEKPIDPALYFKV